ncbi:uncharacterized protein LOC128932178 [Callithrix jacchus]|uniref:protein enabled homolog n=1 Tax=Callithrix jacchus TaxID=9483 RepID=UPI0023DD19E0|nr:protein enabled homolog [Callithrix jacchus]
MLRGVASGGNLPPPPPPPPSEPRRPGSRAPAWEEEVVAQLGQQQVGRSAPGRCGCLIAAWPWAKLPTPSRAPRTSRFPSSRERCALRAPRGGLRGASAGERRLPPWQDCSSAPARLPLPCLSAGAPTAALGSPQPRLLRPERPLSQWGEWLGRARRAPGTETRASVAPTAPLGCFFSGLFAKYLQGA